MIFAIPAALLIFIIFLILANPGPTPDRMPWGERLFLTAAVVAAVAVFTLTPASALLWWVAGVSGSQLADAVAGFEQGRQDGATP